MGYTLQSERLAIRPLSSSVIMAASEFRYMLDAAKATKPQCSMLL